MSNEFCLVFRLDCGPYFWNRIAISENLTFSDNRPHQEFKCQL